MMKNSQQDILVSIVMSTYKEPLIYIKHSVLSILNQTHSNIEFVIIIDAPDNKPIVDFIREISLSDNRVKYHINNQNMGLVKSLNIGVSLSTGEYIARMDADDISLPNRIEDELNFLLNGDFDLVGSNVINIDENGNEIGSITNFPTKMRWIKRYYRYGVSIPHPTWLFTRSLYKRLGGYRNIQACEDYDFVCRAIIAGSSLGVISKPLLKYRINTGGISQTKKAIQKTSFLYLSSQYKKKKWCSENDYLLYIDSNDGKNQINQIECFYNNKKSSGVKPKNLLNAAIYNGPVRKLMINELSILVLNKFH